MAKYKIINGINSLDACPQKHIITNINFNSTSESTILDLLKIAIEEKAEITLTVEQAKELIKKNTTISKIQLWGQTAKDISSEDLSELENKINITGVLLKSNINEEIIGAGEFVYTPYIYKLCRNKIDEIISDINIGRFEESQDRDYLIFSEVIKRLSNDISYNYQQNAYLPNKIISRNMEGALLDGSAVCVGYSETLKQVLACCNIESEVVLALSKTSRGHAWNQVKLNNKWYNIDLTNARDAIVEGREPFHTLVSDIDFYPRSLYLEESIVNENHQCNESMSDFQIVEMLYGARAQKVLKITSVFAPNALQDFRDNYSYTQKKYIRHTEKELTNIELKWEQRMAQIENNTSQNTNQQHTDLSKKCNSSCEDLER